MVKFIGFCAVFLLCSFFLVPAFYGISEKRETILATNNVEPSAEDLNAILPAAGDDMIQDSAPIGNFDAAIKPKQDTVL